MTQVFGESDGSLISHLCGLVVPPMGYNLVQAELLVAHPAPAFCTWRDMHKHRRRLGHNLQGPQMDNKSDKIV